MKKLSTLAAAIALLGTQAVPAPAGGASGPRSHGAQIHQSQPGQRWQQNHAVREPMQRDASNIRGQAHDRFGGPRLDQRPDPNYQNPYRPMFSPDAVNPGEQHPYFRTPNSGFGYPTGNSGIYQGNGYYVIPR